MSKNHTKFILHILMIKKKLSPLQFGFRGKDVEACKCVLCLQYRSCMFIIFLNWRFYKYIYFFYKKLFWVAQYFTCTKPQRCDIPEIFCSPGKCKDIGFKLLQRQLENPRWVGNIPGIMHDKCKSRAEFSNRRIRNLRQVVLLELSPTTTSFV